MMKKIFFAVLCVSLSATLLYGFELVKTSSFDKLHFIRGYNECPLLKTYGETAEATLLNFPEILQAIRKKRANFSLEDLGNHPLPNMVLVAEDAKMHLAMGGYSEFGSRKTCCVILYEPTNREVRIFRFGTHRNFKRIKERQKFGEILQPLLKLGLEIRK